jgi:cellulose synthase/poly-beta-1,6-N-acetylglucosamine synthase-like glycosyltransferase
MQYSQAKREITFIRGTVLASAIIFLGIYASTFMDAYASYRHHNYKGVIAAVVFSVTVFFIAYGNFLYQLCLIGYHKRKLKHEAVSEEALAEFYNGKAPSIAVLVPSYKEELSVIRQTLLSAALSEYPHKDVVLLIDDPYQPRVLEDVVKLEKTRKLSNELQEFFLGEQSYYLNQQEQFQARCNNDEMHTAIELNRLSLLFEQVAQWLEELAVGFQDERSLESVPYAERFFFSRTLLEPSRKHRAFAQQLRTKITRGEVVSNAYLAQQYARLVGIFTVNFSHFERKKYVNLSHESNKAMNLNSYMGLVGKSWREVEGKNGLELHECSEKDASFTIHDFDYINTIDADTLMTHDYILSLVHEMEKPENKQLAVAQSPCSTIPSPYMFERAAGALIDMGFLVHQGYSHWNVGFWVGANALLRRSALENIKEVRMENGHPVSVYIQDRTVIEDTESSVDLLYKGWNVYNYPERMTFSPTPPDFGSLLIQRRRWANGGLIILPKLIKHMLAAPKTAKLMKGFCLHFYYLASSTIGCMTMLMWMVYPFGKLTSNALLPMISLPFFLLLMRNLRDAGYRRREIINIYTANLLLMPIHMGGVLKQFQQIITGKKIPFGRTPKVLDRTAAPMLYYMLEMALMMSFIWMTVVDAHRGSWGPAAFSALNAAIMYYAFTHFIGVKAMAEDFASSVSSYWRNAFHHAEIIPMPSRSVRAAESASRISA